MGSRARRPRHISGTRAGWPAERRLHARARCCGAGRRASRPRDKCLEAGGRSGAGCSNAHNVGDVDEVDGLGIVGNAARAVAVGGKGVVGQRDAVYVEDLDRRVGNLPVVLPGVVVKRTALQRRSSQKSRTSACRFQQTVHS